MGRAEPCPADIELRDRPPDDDGEHLLLVPIFAQRVAVSIQRAHTQILTVARRLKGKLDVRLKAPGIGCRIDGQDLELGDQEQAGNPVEFISGPSEFVEQISVQSPDGPREQAEDGVRREPLSAGSQCREGIGVGLGLLSRARLQVDNHWIGSGSHEMAHRRWRRGFAGQSSGRDFRGAHHRTLSSHIC